MEEMMNPVQGVVVPLITPVDGAGRVDEAALRKLIERCLAGGVEGLFVGGSAGMGPMLEDDEWRRAVEITADAACGRACLLGGVIETSTPRALRKIRLLEQAGYPAFVVTPTFYITLAREEEFLTHFAACHDATAMRMVVYNIPMCTGSMIPVPVFRRMCEAGWLGAIKESSGDRAYFSELLALGREHKVNVLQGNEPNIAWGLAQGTDGIVPVCANYEPLTLAAAMRAAREGRLDRLEELQRRIDLLRDTFFIGDFNWIAGVMYAVATLGIGSGVPLAPLREVSEERKRIIEQLRPIQD